MDTSEKYILMCEKAVEIQIPKIILDCEPCIIDSSKNLKVYASDFVAISNTKKTVWLPRQDQIQEMFFEGGYFPINEFKRFELFFWPHWTNYSSFEQAWLSFLMYRKYNKIWKNNTWEAL